MKALTAAEMREVDRLTIERHGISGQQLMENAGKCVAGFIQQRYATFRMPRIAVLCGKGNNGGDGLVAARLLKELRGVDVSVFLFARPDELQGDTASNLKKWLETPSEIVEIADDSTWEHHWPRISKSNVIVDALLGTGLRGGATGLLARAIDRLNEHSKNATRPCPALIVAVDTPSGLPSDGQAAEGSVLRAHYTVTFTAPKVGQLVANEAPCCGQLHVCAIGTPDSLVEEVGKGSIRWSGPDEFTAMPLVRAADSHKGTFGHVLIVAGSLGKSGAAILAGQSGLFGGAGLVTIATPDSVQPVVAAARPEYMTEALHSTDAGTVSISNLTSPKFQESLTDKSALAIGPGLGTHPETQKFIREVVRQTALPIILDADGLNAFGNHSDLLRERSSRFLAITPHPGEMARLLGSSSANVQRDRVKTAVDAAKRWNVFVILKGFHTVLASPSGEVLVNTTGNAGLAKGGSGDVLTGLLGALTSQFGTEDWLRVLALGVYLHGAAADAPARSPDLSGMMALELAKAVPSARASLVREIRRRA